jgi:hypothetical protein
MRLFCFTVKEDGKWEGKDKEKVEEVKKSRNVILLSLKVRSFKAC